MPPTPNYAFMPHTVQHWKFQCALTLMCLKSSCNADQANLNRTKRFGLAEDALA